MKKNKKIIVVVFVMLLTVSIALAYFVGRTLLDGKGANTTVTTANIHGATLKVEGELNFNAEGMLPGHKDISRIKVTATGNNELIPYNLIWTGNNTLATNLKFTVYKTSSQIETSSTCKKHDEQVSGGRKLYETCEIKNESQMGEVLTTGTIRSSSESIKVELAKDEFINATPDGQVVYYYIIIEYPNENSDQYPQDKGGSFNGVINAEASDTKPDINIIAAYIENEETGKYDKTDTIPQSGYIINSDMSVCNNEAVPGYGLKNNRVYFERLAKSGTECELYFDIIPVEKVLSNLNLSKQGTLEKLVTGPSCEEGNANCGGNGINMQQNGLYEVEDDDGKSYIFRGTVDNNWVKFGKDSSNQDIWWRILRINGNGSIRLIYAGVGNTAPSSNGENAIDKQAYNTTYNDNTYVGYYTVNAKEKATDSYETAHNDNEKSNIASQVDIWFTNTTKLNEAEYIKYIDKSAGFCNDRGRSIFVHAYNYTNEGFGNKYTWYAPFDRVAESITSTNWNRKEQTPTLKCANKERDYFTWKGHTKEGNQKLENPVGLITMDEVILAGGFAGQANSGYWLYTGVEYWTMSPYRFYIGDAYVFSVTDTGFLNNATVRGLYGVRPVINLKAKTSFEPSNNNGDWGTINNPYVVKIN